MKGNQRVRYNDMAAKAMQLGLSSAEVSQLVRINSTLHTWGEHECNGVIQRDEDTGKCYWVYDMMHGRGYSRDPTSDRETGAIKRAKAIADSHGLGFYHQSDPRGVQVYLYRPENLDGLDIESCYSSVGVAIYRPS